MWIVEWRKEVFLVSHKIQSSETLLQSYPEGLKLVLSLQSKRSNKECILVYNEWGKLYKNHEGRKI